MIKQRELGDGVVALLFASETEVNTLDSTTNRQLLAMVPHLLADPAVKGLVIGSEKTDFAAGGDLKELQAARSVGEVRAIVRPFLEALRLLETGAKPVVAAMPGTALGGGLELALACHYRIAADGTSGRFGLPEVTLGLMPGAGGTQRLPRLIGIAAAGPLLLEGKRLSLHDARACGIVDQVVPAGHLLAAAKAWVLANPEVAQPWDRKGFVMPGFGVQSAAGRQYFAAIWARLRKQGGGNNRAGEAILQAMRDGLERSIDAGIRIETREFARLACSNDAKNMIRTLFTGVNRAKSMKARPSGLPPSRVSLLGVLGGGVMGRGIAQTAAMAGIDVVLLDVDADAAARSLETIGNLLVKEAEKGRLKTAPEDVLSHIRATGDYLDLARADFLVEAVFERADVKHQVLRRAAEVVGADVPIASNTSTIPIGGLATAVAHPERFIGLHFFSPVDRMPLVEVIRGTGTSEGTLARALDFLQQLSKTPVVVNDGLGFFTSRIVTTYSMETLSLIGEGVPAQVIDNAAVNAGFTLGGASLAELTTLPLLADIFRSMRGDGQRIANGGLCAEQTVASLLELGRTGKAAGKGLYDYGPDGRDVWPGLAEHFPQEQELDEDTVRRRLFHVQSLEAVRSLDDGILKDPLDGDVAAVLGWGYPSHLGGPFAYIDRVGVAAFIGECEALAERFGPRFTPPSRLRRMAEADKTFYR